MFHSCAESTFSGFSVNFKQITTIQCADKTNFLLIVKHRIGQRGRNLEESTINYDTNRFQLLSMALETVREMSY